MTENGREKLKEYLLDMEETLARNGMPARCIQEIMFSNCSRTFRPVAYASFH